MAEAFFQDIDIFTAILFAAILGIVPLYLAISQSFRSRILGDGAKSIITGIAFGAMIFFVVDLFEGASTLGVDFGTRSFEFRVALVGSFAMGLIIPAILEPPLKKGEDAHGQNERLAYLFALSMGFHAFAEGVVIGYDVTSGFGFSLLQRTVQTLSFVLHKGGEGLAISIPLMFRVSSSGISRTVIYCSLLAGAPLILGTASGFLGLTGIAASFAFSAGAGGLTYVIFRLARFPVDPSNGKVFYLGILLGLLYMYFAGSIHAIGF